MRVIAGSLKGRRLKPPTWAGLRPTSDKLRETLFNILAPRLAGARVMDGYAGTGAVGIEALSRGAAHVTFVDSDARPGRSLPKTSRTAAWRTAMLLSAGASHARSRRSAPPTRSASCCSIPPTVTMICRRCSPKRASSSHPGVCLCSNMHGGAPRRAPRGGWCASAKCGAETACSNFLKTGPLKAA